jgi:hypothetical protein
MSNFFELGFTVGRMVQNGDDSTVVIEGDEAFSYLRLVVVSTRR